MGNNKIRMVDPSDHIEMIHVDPGCVEHPVTKAILSRARDIPVKIIADDTKIMDGFGVYPKSLTAGKRHLLLGRNRGRFFKPCPGTREYICCDYRIVSGVSAQESLPTVLPWIILQA